MTTTLFSTVVCHAGQCDKYAYMYIETMEKWLKCMLYNCLEWYNTTFIPRQTSVVDLGGTSATVE